MKKSIIWIAVILIIVLVVWYAWKAPKASKEASVSGPTSNVCQDLSCIMTNFTACNPAISTLTTENGTVTISIVGFENDKCHFKMDFQGHGSDCLFNRGDLSSELLDQVFGNDVGKADILTQSCTNF